MKVTMGEEAWCTQVTSPQGLCWWFIHLISASSFSGQATVVMSLKCHHEGCTMTETPSIEGQSVQFEVSGYYIFFILTNIS